MTFDEVYESLPGAGWLTKPEARLLWDTAKATEGPILECGCHLGRSTVLLASLDRLVYAVDPWLDDFDSDRSGDERHELFRANLNGRGIGNVSVFMQRIENWTPLPVGFCYLDGDHTYSGTVAQIRKALAGNPRAIAIHDVNDDGGGREIKRAALELLGPWRTRVERLAVWKHVR